MGYGKHFLESNVFSYQQTKEQQLFEGWITFSHLNTREMFFYSCLEIYEGTSNSTNCDHFYRAIFVI